MEDVFAIVIFPCLLFLVGVGGYFVMSPNATTHSIVIETCEKVGQFQYGMTVVECKVVKNGK